MKTKFRIAVVLPYNQPDNRMRVAGIFDFFSAHEDANVIVIDSSSPYFPQDCDRLTADGAVNGIIFSYQSDIRQILQRMPSQRPILARLDGQLSCISPAIDIRLDTAALTYSTVSFLKRRGYRHFAFCGTDNPLDLQYSRELERYFLKATRSDSATAVFRESPKTSFGENLKRGTRWVAELVKPCTVMCYSDELARNLLIACKAAHISVPEQVSIIGLGNTTEICELTHPTLSSVVPDFWNSGTLAAEALYRLLNGRKCHGKTVTQTYSIKTIIERGSTRDMRGCGRIVTAATELIRLTPLRDLTADYVATKLNTSRRLLEMHFKSVLGRGVHAEISRRRLETICARLVSSEDTLSLIAEDCGFRTANAAQIAFKKRYNQTMREFRQARRTSSARGS